MRLLNSILLLAATSFIGLSNASIFTEQQRISSQHTSSILKNNYIIEFSGSNAEADKKKLTNLLETKFSDTTLTFGRLFNHDLMKGVTIQIGAKDQGGPNSQSAAASEEEQEKLLNQVFKAVSESGLVKNIYPVVPVQGPDTDVKLLNESIDFSKISSHVQTQVDRVHKELNNTGEGITVGIIDTGIDYTHPALGGGFGEGYKVRYGKDLVGDNYGYSSAVPEPDDDPMDSCSARTGSVGHGTHVAGIIGGKYDNFTGVAPDVTLGMWRVFSCYGASSDDIILDAVLDAYDAGVDLISMSLGSFNGWSESPISVVVERVINKGVPVVVSAGNDGNLGSFAVSSPSVARGALSVASFDNNNVLTTVFKVRGSSKTYAYQDSSRKVDDMPSKQLVAGDKKVGGGSDACEASAIPKGVKGKIALVQRGGCSFDDKANNLADAGAVGVAIFATSDTDDVLMPAVSMVKIPVVGVSYETGQFLLKTLKGKKINLIFDGKKEARKATTGNTVSWFSSVGASYDLGFAPNIAGVGGNVLSTLPQQLGGWGLMSGTSMAAPDVAGSVALLLKQYKDAEKETPSPAYILEQFQNYAYKAAHAYNDPNTESPFRQGAGLVQVYDTLTQGPHVTPGHISFNDTTNIEKTHTITLTNNGDRIVSYKLVNNVSVSVNPYQETTDYLFNEPAKFGTDVAKMRFSKKTLKISPGKSVDVKVTVIPPSTDPALHIMYGGFITFKSQQKQTKDITVPYAGIVGDQRQLPIYSEDMPYLTNSSDPARYAYVWGANDTFVFDRRDKDGQTPTFVFRLTNPTRHIASPVYNSRGRKIGDAFVQLEYLARTPSTYSSYTYTWDGKYYPYFFNLRMPLPLPVLPGKYQIGLDALKWLGDEDNDDDREKWLSPVIQVK